MVQIKNTEQKKLLELLQKHLKILRIKNTEQKQFATRANVVKAKNMKKYRL